MRGYKDRSQGTEGIEGDGPRLPNALDINLKGTEKVEFCPPTLPRIGTFHALPITTSLEYFSMRSFAINSNSNS